MLKYIDIHTHEYYSTNEVISVYNIIIGQNQVNTEQNKYYSAGIHPWYLHSDNLELYFKYLSQEIEKNNIIAIGECGIDLLKSYLEISLQEKVFIRHVELSEQKEKPLIIHCVRAYDKIIYWHKKIRPKQNWIVHGIKPNEYVIYNLLNQGIKISFGKLVFIANDSRLHFIKKLSENDFFIESDEESYPFITQLYQKISEIRKQSIIDLQISQMNNFVETFKIKLE